MIYIVSGLHRSGTSMMMSALVEGGIIPIYSKQREKAMRLNNTKDYTVNPDGFYEVGQQEYMRLGFTSELPSECCVKIQALGLPILSAAKGYKIIYMRRDPAAIKKSFIKAFSEREFNKKYDDWPTHYFALLDGVKAIMQQRRDVELLELQFDDVISNPRKVFTQIAAMGVPIDINKAISIVKPEFKRCG